MLKVTASPDRLIAYNSQVFAGLYDLRAAGEIQLSFSRQGFPRLSDDTQWPQIVALRIDDPSTGRTHKVAIDLIDGEHIASPLHHSWANVYFKSSFRRSAADFDPSKHAPFGLTYACTSTEETVWDRLRLAFESGRDQNDRVRKRAQWLRQLVSHPSFLLAGRHKYTEMHSRIPPRVPFFETLPNTGANPVVYYRTRVYPIREHTSEYNAAEFTKVNEMRVATIRALKKALGAAFVGGLRNSPYALAHYPDLVIRENWGWRRHLQTVQTSLVCVTTSGLFDSMDWKVAEYLAASRCMVSERFKFDLPTTPEQGEHLLTFTTPEECVQHCLSLLKNPERAQRMRELGYKFYQQHVKPISLMRNCISAVLDHGHKR